MNVKDEYVRWIYRINVSNKCIGCIYRMNVSDKYIGWIYRMTESDEYIGWMYQMNLSDECIGWIIGWMYRMNVLYECIRWMYWMKLFHECIGWNYRMNPSSSEWLDEFFPPFIEQSEIFYLDKSFTFSEISSKAEQEDFLYHKPRFSSELITLDPVGFHN